MVCKLRLRALASPKEEDGSAGENVVSAAVSRSPMRRAF